MPIVTGIKFKSSGKVYYFDPAGIEFAENDGAIVETARGIEYGKISMANKEVEEKEVVSPLKKVIRKATEEDERIYAENLNKRDEIMRTAEERARKYNLALKFVDAEYTFDRSKIIIYFTAEGRIDFRELVKDLAGVFHVRIELRQIYERDDIRLRGALASCGRECCCSLFLEDFEKVSVKMAKVQNLSLNPAKISGVCGKLLCCLKYENDYYAQTYKKMPKLGAKVTTPAGEGTVEDTNILKKTVKVKELSEEGGFIVKEYQLAQLKINAPAEKSAEKNFDEKEVQEKNSADEIE